MDKAILKKFAVESRKDLMEKIKNKINTFYIDEEFKKEQKGEIYVLSNEKHSLSLTNEEYQKRELLIKRIKELSLEQVIEEAAYTWFNRIIAIRYMEINDYLPLTKDNQSLGIRVLSSKDNTPDPAILKFTNLMNPDLDIDFKKEKYVELKDDNEKFKYVLLLVCKKLGRVIPQVFDGTTDYIDILIPDNLLNDTGFVTKIINEVPEDNYNQVEIIGWLYQFYISEKKDGIFADLKKNIKIKKENIPSATQIFTPDWIVKYMVENTLGRYTSKEFVKKLKYYIYKKDDFNENVDIRKIKFLDPCCGSGHILVYAFEMFCKIYEFEGYNKKDIPELVLKNNLYGLDIDDRAGQLSILSILLKAREYDKNIFNKDIVKNINIISIQETNNISDNIIENLDTDKNKELAFELINTYYDAKEVGSLINVKNIDYTSLLEYITKNNTIFSLELQKLLPLININYILSQKYNVVVTNPPYMGSKGMSEFLMQFLKKYYPNSKSDTFAAFIEKCRNFTKENGYYAMITQPSILFLSSFEELRKNIITEQTIYSLLHMGRGVFGIDFGSTSFVIKNAKIEDSVGDYFKLHQRTFQYIDIDEIERIFLNSKNDIDYKYDFSKYKSASENLIENDNDITENEKQLGELKIHYKLEQDKFELIPGMPLSFWLNNNIYEIFKSKTLKEYGNAKFGMSSGDGEKYIRNWYEVDINEISFDIKSEDEYIKIGKKWNPLDKGGTYRKWYGNKTNIVLWENNGFEIRNNKKSAVRSPQYFFKPHISWPLISSVGFNARLFEDGFILDTASNCLYYNNEVEKKYLLAVLNSKICNEVLKILNPTMNFSCGVVEKMPIIFKQNELIDKLVSENIEISSKDWDSFEISWDFQKHPLIKEKEKFHYGQIGGTEYKISDCYNHWQDSTEMSFNKLKDNEEKLNEIFIDIYGLKDELTSEVDDKDITIRKADKEREIKSLISYAVGCMFGRYSLDKEGLIYAGGDFDEIYKKCKKTDGGWAGASLSNYKVLNDNGQEIDLSFEVDNDNIIPITDESYFGDDIVERFKTFISVVYGEKTLNENLDLIAETLGKKGTETSEDTIRRYFVNDFFNDHVKTYQKRPIYWLFDSGKKNGFKALVYMHRYNENLIPKVRLDYLHRMQTTYEKLLVDVNDKLTSELSMTDKKEAQKRQADLNAKLQEIKEYDEKIAHIANQRISIDLDDGVKLNYDKFKDILAKIK